ncbi:MAG TPA: hypothetical protein PKY87_12500, partial [Terricaulis sp.]|nr:hypothetical protein [Terricaulis sp.]
MERQRAIVHRVATQRAPTPHAATRVAAWGEVAPAVTTANLVVTFTSTFVAFIAATTYTGVDQTTPTSGVNSHTPTSGTALDVAVSSETDAVVHGVGCAWATGLTGPGGSQTERVNEDSFYSELAFHVATVPGAASTAIAWTVVDPEEITAAAALAFSIDPAAAGGGVSITSGGAISE